MRLAAGLRPEPLQELERSPDSLDAIEGCLPLRGEGREGEKRRKRMGRGRDEGEGREGREGRLASHCF